MEPRIAAGRAVPIDPAQAPPGAAAYRVEMSGRDWRVEATARGNFFMPDKRVPTGTFRAVVTPLAADGPRLAIVTV